MRVAEASGYVGKRVRVVYAHGDGDMHTEGLITSVDGAFMLVESGVLQTRIPIVNVKEIEKPEAERQPILVGDLEPQA